jgi:hypothetical protein
MEAEKQPGICFQVVSNWYGRKPVYSAIFPANFRPNLNIYLGLLWAGVHATPESAEALTFGP